MGILSVDRSVYLKQKESEDRGCGPRRNCRLSLRRSEGDDAVTAEDNPQVVGVDGIVAIEIGRRADW